MATCQNTLLHFNIVWKHYVSIFICLRIIVYSTAISQCLTRATIAMLDIRSESPFQLFLSLALSVRYRDITSCDFLATGSEDKSAILLFNFTVNNGILVYKLYCRVTYVLKNIWMSVLVSIICPTWVCPDWNSMQ